jgi:hypothetical protein
MPSRLVHYRDVGGLHGPVNGTGQVISHRPAASWGAGKNRAGISGDRISRPAAVP